MSSKVAAGNFAPISNNAMAVSSRFDDDRRYHRQAMRSNEMNDCYTENEQSALWPPGEKASGFKEVSLNFVFLLHVCFESIVSWNPNSFAKD